MGIREVREPALGPYLGNSVFVEQRGHEDGQEIGSDQSMGNGEAGAGVADVSQHTAATWRERTRGEHQNGQAIMSRASRAQEAPVTE